MGKRRQVAYRHPLQHGPRIGPVELLDRRMPSRQFLAIASLVLLGLVTSYLLRSARPLGRDVGASSVAAQVLADNASPRLELGKASLTVVMFTDYGCPACRQADPALRSAVARDGNIRLVYKDWPIFGERSEQAARVALAAHYQGIYPAFHHRLMSSPRLNDEALRQHVERAGGNWEQLEADLLARRSAIESQLAANERDAFALGLQGTPGYLIGSVLIQGAHSEGEFLRAFKQARGKG